MSALKFAACGGAAPLYVNDVFSAYTYTGTGASLGIVNGINLSTLGGMVWTKGRSNAVGNRIYNTARGATNYLTSYVTDAQASYSESLTAFNANGFTLGADGGGNDNYNTYTYVGWTFANKANFYWHDVVVKSGGSNATFNFSMHTAGLGMVRVKRTDAAGSWYIWHRSLTAGKLLIGETTAAEATLGHITVSGTTVTLVNGVIADGTYLVEAWAHDTSATGIIQCGSFTSTGSDVITFGWEPQYVLMKIADSTGSAWEIWDTARGMSQTTGPDLVANTAVAEAAGGAFMKPNATGLTQLWFATGTVIYLAIRRPNKPPTSGTQVYNAIARAGTGAAATVTGVGFAPDLVIPKSTSTTWRPATHDRLRGKGQTLYTNMTAIEDPDSLSITSFNMDGITIGSDGNSGTLNFSGTYINYFFRRAPGFFDEVCYTGTGANRTVAHNLGVAPELIIQKTRAGEVRQWFVECSAITSPHANWWRNYMVLNSTLASTDFGADTGLSAAPSSTEISYGSYIGMNGSGYTYVLYLFATLAGISKVGSFTGNGSSQTINCGFTTGARFILIKRTDVAGDWFVWDSVRGIVAGNDPHLSFNTTAAEVTTDDSIDPDTSGFIVNQLAATDINVTSATYIFLSLA